MEIWAGITFNVAAIILVAIGPRPNHVEDMREMFNISKGAISHVRHRIRRWRRQLPPAARVTTLVIQRAFSPLLLASAVALTALAVSAYFYPAPTINVSTRAIAIASNTLDRLSQGAFALPNAARLDTSLPLVKLLLASFTFVITVGLVRVLQQWMLSILRTLVCLVFREGAYEVLAGDARNRPRLAALLGVQQAVIKLDKAK